MLVQFGTSGLAGYGLYFGDGKQQLFGTMSYLVTFFQRDTRQDDMLIVNEPSLNGGRNERPNVKKQASATTNRPMVPPIRSSYAPAQR